MKPSIKYVVMQQDLKFEAARKRHTRKRVKMHCESFPHVTSTIVFTCIKRCKNLAPLQQGGGLVKGRKRECHDLESNQGRLGHNEVY